MVVKSKNKLTGQPHLFAFNGSFVRKKYILTPSRRGHGHAWWNRYGSTMKLAKNTTVKDAQLSATASHYPLLKIEGPMFHTVYFVISSCLVFTCTLYIVICVQTLFDCITFLFFFFNCMIVSQSYVTLVSKFGIGILTTLYYLLSPFFFFFF